MKSFKTESKKIMEMMINSIYTHKEIFLRELISNCSDAIDKLYFKGLKEGLTGLTRDDFHIDITADKKNGTLTIEDNGIGMTAEELETNLGTIAHSGTLQFKEDNQDVKEKEDLGVIGQFGVGFYSAFMVADEVRVCSKAYGSDEAHEWKSKGIEGYEIKPCEKDSYGTTVVLHMKKDTDDEKYSSYLEEYELKSLIKKYSDYIRYAIRMEVTKYKELTDEERKEGKSAESYLEQETINSMVPLWKKNKSELTSDDYNKFFKDTFYEYEDPLRVIHTSAEGTVSYKALLFVPATLPYNYYSKNFEKGLKLYTDGVLIMDRCEDLLPDYFSFVKGLVDSDLTLNISRETIQHDRQLKLIASNLEKKIKNELADMMANNREDYVKFYEKFGLQLKYGIYSGWGMNKEVLQDLIMFKSVKTGNYVSLKEYVDGMAEGQKFIYYGNGKTDAAIKALPQVEKVLDLGYDVLVFSEDVDEFAVKMLNTYAEKSFKNILDEDLGINTDDEKKFDDDKDLVEAIKEKLGDRVSKVKVSTMLKTHPVCLSSEGEVSIEMEKVLNQIPENENKVKANKILEINGNHKFYEKLKAAYAENKDSVADYAEILYAAARLMAGLPVENITDVTDKIFELLA